MKFNKANRRKNMRLGDYDYSHAGLYFVTICLQNRLQLLGSVKNGEMILNDAGHQVEHWYNEIENKYPDKRCHEMMIMPNHFHCIIENLIPNDTTTQTDAHVGAPLRGRPQYHNKYGFHNKMHGATLGTVMNWFKTMTTNAYIRGVKNHNWEQFNGKLWQRGYYDHIIRDPSSYRRIANYILNNPKNWDTDRFNNDQ